MLLDGFIFPSCCGRSAKLSRQQHAVCYRPNEVTCRKADAAHKSQDYSCFFKFTVGELSGNLERLCASMTTR